MLFQRCHAKNSCRYKLHIRYCTSISGVKFSWTTLYSYLESGPLLPSPWYRSQFLSHAYDLLSDREEFTYMTEYMNMTGALGQYAEGLRKGC